MDEEIPLVSALIKRNLISRRVLGQAVAAYYEVAFADLDVHMPTAEQVLRIPKTPGQKYRMIVASETERQIIIATDNPKQKNLKTALRELFPKYQVEIQYALPDTIDLAFLHYRMPLVQSVKYTLKQNRDDAPGVIDAIFDDALIKNVSDIHFEPRQEKVVVRFRIDGLLQEVLQLETRIYRNVVNRIKVESHLRIDDHFAAQDGAMHYEGESRSADMRISIVPTTYGEKIVIRVLSRYVRDLALADLGMSPDHQLLLRRAADKPFGMIIVVGPTGSGKTTTLYSLIGLLNSPEVNITTIEDPVEYKIPGVNQIQVNLATGLTFARGLRSIVRQDPDVILVGEIRDRETAEIAVNAALTGHLVLTTFHANDAATAIPRLLDMGIEPFLLASTLELVIGQRLVRRLVEGASVKKKSSKKELEKQYDGISPYISGRELSYWEPRPGEDQAGRAYSGRTAVYEMIPVTDAMEELIITSPSAREVLAEAQRGGVMTMFEDGLTKVHTGETSLSELMRVVQPVEKNDS